MHSNEVFDLDRLRLSFDGTDWHRPRDESSTRDHVVYLDYAFAMPRQPRIARAAAEFEESFSPFLDPVVNSLIDEAMERIAGHYGLPRRNAPRDDLAVISGGCTAATAWCIKGFSDWEASDNAVIASSSYHTMVEPLLDLMRAGTIKEIRIAPARTGTIGLAELGERVDSNTKMILVPHVSNLFGSENPVKEICRWAHGEGRRRGDPLYVLVDGASADCQIPVDVLDIGCDFFVSSANKVGSEALGCLYMASGLIQKIEPLIKGDFGVKFLSHTRREVQQDYRKFISGITAYSATYKLTLMLLLFDRIGVHNVCAHNAELTMRLQEAVRRMEQYEVLPGVPEAPVGLVTFSYRDTDRNSEIAEHLYKRYRIRVRALEFNEFPYQYGVEGYGRFKGQRLLRASVHYPTTQSDMEMLIHALKAV